MNSSKNTPAKPGGFICEPLEAVWFTEPTGSLNPSKGLLHQL